MTELSVSALNVTKICSLISKSPKLNFGFNDPYSDLFISNHSIGARIGLGVIKSSLGRKLILNKINSMLPGLPEFVLYRKMYIADYLRKRASEGFEQLVIYGAGLDSTPMRLERDLKDLKIYEVDHPKTQEYKKAVLKKEKINCANVRYVGVDFEKESLMDRLSLTDYNKNLKTIFLAEAVLEFLSPQDAKGVFELSRKICPSGSAFIFTAIDNWLLESVYFKKMNPKLRSEEKFSFAIDDKILEEFLLGLGFALKKSVSLGSLFHSETEAVVQTGQHISLVEAVAH